MTPSSRRIPRCSNKYFITSLINTLFYMQEINFDIDNQKPTSRELNNHYNNLIHLCFKLFFIKYKYEISLIRYFWHWCHNLENGALFASFIYRQ